VLDSIAVPDEDLKKYHESHKADFTEPGKFEVGNLVVSSAKFNVEPNESELRAFYAKRGVVDCRHILVKEETLAVELRQKLLAADDTTFVELCKPLRRSGLEDKGGVYKTSAAARWSPASLPLGRPSTPVKTDFRYHLCASTPSAARGTSRSRRSAPRWPAASTTSATAAPASTPSGEADRRQRVVRDGVGEFSDGRSRRRPPSRST
jgi:hypothetical protein